MAVDGRTPNPVSLAELQGADDVPQQDVTSRDPGGRTVTERAGGVSAARLLTLLHLTPGAVRSLAVERPGGGTPVTLTAAEVEGGFDGDPQGHRVATFDPGYGDEVHFFRPLRDAADVNDADALALGGADLSVAITTDGSRRLQDVTPLAAPLRPDPGAQIAFSVTVADAPDAQFRWDFGDGARTAGATPTHAFAAAGTYVATVTALTPDGSSGVGSLTLVVGTPTDGGTATTPAPSPAAAPAGGSGGAGSGGGSASAGGGSAGPQAAASGAQQSTSTTPATASTTPERTTPRPATTARTPAPTTAPAAATTTPVPAASGGSPPPTPGSASTTPSTTARAIPAPRRTRTRPAATPRPAGPQVRGVLAAGQGSDVAAAVAAARALADQAPTTPPAARAAAGGGGVDVLGGLAGGAVLLVLLGAGALREGLPRSRPA